jgi:hypothetical protein
MSVTGRDPKVRAGAVDVVRSETKVNILLKIHLLKDLNLNFSIVF